MDYQTWLKGLKVGGEVMVVREMTDVPFVLRIVESVTKSGRVRVRKYTDNPAILLEYGSDGHVRGCRSGDWLHRDSFAFTRIVEPTEELVAQLKELREKQRHDNWRSNLVQNLVMGVDKATVESLTDDELRALEEILFKKKDNSPTPGAAPAEQ